MHQTRSLRVNSPDGVGTTVEIAGRDGAQGVILIHGMLHSRLIWKRQFSDPVLSGLQLAAYDVRGHGDADKPVDAASYDAPRYADELKAVIEATGMKRPILVGWSLGSRVMFSYLATYGAAALGGMVIVGARMKVVSQPKSSTDDAMSASCSDELETRIRGRKAFVLACHEVPLSPEDLLEITASSMVMPPQVLRTIAGRPLDVEALMTALDIPVRIIQGTKDRVNMPAYAEAAARLNPSAGLSMYEGIGHTPFFEAPDRFNRELLDFAGLQASAGKEAVGAGQG